MGAFVTRVVALCILMRAEESGVMVDRARSFPLEDPMIKMLHEKGIKSEHAYTAGFVSIGMAVASWFASMQAESRGIERADRWGIFIGEWAPTFFGIGLALANYERDHGRDKMQAELDEMMASRG